MSQATERVREYLRQRKMQQGAGDLIHGTWMDAHAEMAELTIADLEDILETAEQYESLCE